MKQPRSTPRINAAINKATIERSRGRLPKAIEILEELARGDEGFALVYASLVSVYAQRLGDIRLEDGESLSIRGRLKAMATRRVQLAAVYRFPNTDLTSSGRPEPPDPRQFPRFPRGPWAGLRRRAGFGFNEIARSNNAEVGYTPHLDTVAIEQEGLVIVRVYLDGNAFRPGELGQRLIAKPGTTVQVHILTSDHFTLRDAGITAFVVDPEKDRIDLPPIILEKSLESSTVAGQPYITVVFTVDGRPCGNVKRAVDRDGAAIADTTVGETFDFVLDPGPTADLSVVITESPDRDGRRFSCIVTSPHLPEYSDGKKANWTLGAKSEDIVAGLMDRFTAPATKPNQLIAELKGAGKLLFDAAPEIFKSAVWELIEAKKPLTSIAVVSEEQFVPWELMIPNGGPNDEAHDLPLGVSYDVGRWIRKSKAPPRDLAIYDCQIVAPRYIGKAVLKQSQAEALEVSMTFQGTVVTPAPFDAVSTALRSRTSLLHFVCHGKDGGTAGQILLLDDNDQLTDTALIGISGVSAAFRSMPPIIFLNACEVGRGNPSLIGSRSFASQFIKLGARAVIAPLWSVNDTVAHEIALTFYRALKASPQRRLADIFRDIRRKAYETGTDSYAAYCFFGDPLATAE